MITTTTATPPASSPAPRADGSEHHVVRFADVSALDLPRVGGKNASLGEMFGALGAFGVRVPDGFAITTGAYWAFVEHNHLRQVIEERLALRAAGQCSLAEAAGAVRASFVAGAVPRATQDAVIEAYRDLARRSGRREPAVAVRSSATAEDLPDASFAGQQDTFLNVRGETALLDAVRHCLASLFTDRAIAYRESHGIDHLQVALSVGVQLMVRSDIGGAGTMFTLDPETGFPDVVVIQSAWGLGDNVVRGTVDPDEHVVWKPALAEADRRPVLSRKLGDKALTMVLSEGRLKTSNVPTAFVDRARFVLDEDQVLALARWGTLIEAHYSQRAGHDVPMDIEWALDGETHELFVVQARPETVRSREAGAALVTWALDEVGTVIVAGRAVGTGIAAGRVCKLDDPRHPEAFVKGAILVTERTDPDWVPIMKLAGGIVTDHGGRTCHAAIVARELGIPAVVGCGDATRRLSDGAEVTLSCAGGESGQVLSGRLRFRREVSDVTRVPATRTQIMMNLADPGSAFRWWRLPVDGIGLARMEFVISNHVRVHPMAAAHPERVSPQVQATLTALAGDLSPSEYFVQALASGIGTLAASQWPKPVVVRMSDFKSNEYARLVGGDAFEPHEDNPMLGFRGAARYVDEHYRDGFRLECRAMRRVREVMGLGNVILMIPFCRTLDEADRVLALMAQEGLRRGEDGLEIYVMSEIPSNVVLADDFALRFDGFSIGSNDLTQLVLGVDRDSELLAATFDERNPAVVALIREAIAKAHQAGRHIGICGQGPSDHPDLAELLVRAGIDAISLDPGTVIAMRTRVAAIERSEPRA